MRASTRTRVAVVATAGALVVAGPALAQDTYPPVPPPATELPDVLPSTETPTEAVLPDEVERTTPSPADDTAVLPSVVDRLPITGTALVAVLGLAGAFLAAGLVVLTGARRRGRATPR